MNRADKEKALSKTKTVIQRLKKTQDVIFEACCKRLGIDPNDYDKSGFIFDYVFNEFGTAREVVKKIK